VSLRLSSIYEKSKSLASMNQGVKFYFFSSSQKVTWQKRKKSDKIPVLKIFLEKEAADDG